MSYQDNSFTNFDDYNTNQFSKSDDNSHVKPKKNSQNSEMLKMARDEVEKTKQETIITIDKALRRGNEVDNLVENAEGLEKNSYTFYRNSNKLKKQMWCDYCTKKICFFGTIIGVIAFIILIIVLTTKKRH
jgi:predicted  nucleic acid-binding Zn ribbon protein